MIHNHKSILCGALKRLSFIALLLVAIATPASSQDWVNITDMYVENPNFTGNTSSWTVVFYWAYNSGYQSSSYTNGDVTIQQFAEAWIKSPNYLEGGEISQTIDNIPAGTYRLEADVIAVDQSGASSPVAGVSLFLENSVTTNETVVSTGDGAPEHFSVEFTNSTAGSLTLGLRVSEAATANWVAIDNVKLYKYGTEVKVTSVSLNKTSLSLLQGENETLTATVLPTNASNTKVTWTTGDSRIALVSTTGKVYAVGPGTTTITATSNADATKKATCEVTVTTGVDDGQWVDITKSYITNPSFDNNSKAGWTITKFRNGVSVTYATDTRVGAQESWWGTTTIQQSVTLPQAGRYRLSVKGFFRVDNGTNTGYNTFRDGEEEMTAFLFAGDKQVPMASYYSAYLDPDNYSEWINNGSGTTYWLTSDDKYICNNMENAVYQFEHGYYQNSLIFEIDSPSTISIGVRNDEDIEGNWLIIDDWKLEKYGEEVLPTGLSLDKSQLPLKVGETYTLIPTISPSSATNPSVLWTSNNTDVASVSAEGVVYAKKVGTAVITATSEANSSITASCSVTVSANSDFDNLDEDKWLTITDATIKNATLYENPKNADDWTMISTCVNNTWGSGLQEFYNGTANFFQYVTVPAAGIYRIGVKAFYRPGELTSAGYSAHKNGTEDITAYLYANDVQIPVKSIYSEKYTEQNNYNGRKVLSTVDGTYYFPNTMSGAQEAFYDDYYQNYLLVKVDDPTQELKIGICSVNDVTGNWLIMSDWTMEQYDGQVILPTSLELSRTSVTVPVGEETAVTYNIVPSTATDHSLDFDYDTTLFDVYDVNEFIYIYGKAVGKGTLTVTSQANRSVKKTINVTVTAAEELVVSDVAFSLGTDGKLTLSTTTTGATIYYTTNGTTPTATSNIYTAPISLTGVTTVKAIAYKSGYTASQVTTYTVGAKCATPTFTRNGRQLTITTATSGADIYYTTKDNSSIYGLYTKYSSAIPLLHNCTIEAYASKSGLENSATASYTVNDFQTAAPTFSVSDNTLTIKCSQSATIYYVFGANATPTTSSSKYTSPIALGGESIVKAFAVATDFNPSEIVTFNVGTLTCTEPEITFNGHAITITTTMDGAKIYYTLGSKTPSTSSTLYTGPVEMTEVTTINAIVTKSGYNNSSVKSYTMPYFCNGKKAILPKTGVFKDALGSITKSSITSLAIEGSMNATDFETLRSLTNLQHLDLSALGTTTLPTSAFSGMTALQSVSMPVKVTVTSTPFVNCPHLAAIIWNASAAIPATFLPANVNPNLLIYAQMSQWTDNISSSVRNLIHDGVAKSITLSDGSDFYCPKEFIAEQISYTHEYKQVTVIGQSAGWETIALPFNVQTITHQDATKGTLAPFAKNDASAHPFWLYRMLPSGDKFTPAEAIQANTPYILSMPNNSDYAERYNLAGKVTFSAKNAKVVASTALHPVQRGSGSAGIAFVPNYAVTPQTSSILSINRDGAVLNHAQGSVFRSYRTSQPFEAYIQTSSAAGVKEFLIADDDATDIRELFNHQSSIIIPQLYDLSGRKMQQHTTLRRGIYIQQGKKVYVK